MLFGKYLIQEECSGKLSFIIFFGISIEKEWASPRRSQDSSERSIELSYIYITVSAISTERYLVCPYTKEPCEGGGSPSRVYKA